MRWYLQRLFSHTLYVGIVLLLAGIPTIAWYFQEPQYITAIVLDKTVPSRDFREHKGFLWILNNLKYFNATTQKPFRYYEDYFGFVPIDKIRFDVINLPSNLKKKPDIIYIADTYGVYTSDFYTDNYRGKRSSVIYGGTTKADVDFIKNNMPSRALLAEFNTFNTPTESNVRIEMENLFNVRWDEWIGRFFANLDSSSTEIPAWLIRNYENQNRKKWSFSGPGIAYVKSDDTVVILSKNEGDLGDKFTEIRFIDSAVKEFNVEPNVGYYYWFEIVAPRNGAQVLANFRTDATLRGMSKLQKFGIPAFSPAILRVIKPVPTYYFAGDFADNNQIPPFYAAKGFYSLSKLTSFETVGDQNHFYWRCYYPMIEKILSVGTK